MSRFICPPFIGCVITSSGLKQRDEIRELVTKGGISYSAAEREWEYEVTAVKLI